VTSPEVSRPEHWDATYGRRDEDSLSWFQDHPTTSLRLVIDALDAIDARTASDASHAPLGTPGGRPVRVVDVGAGTSRLAGLIAATGRAHVTVLDVSHRALEVVGERLAADGLAAVTDLVVADVTTWRPTQPFDVWHDRAVLHFLTDDDERDAYVRTVTEAITPGGRLIVATFAADGPEVCSALPVRRYSPEDLVAVFADGFEPLDTLREEHVTPDGRVQPFTWAVLSRRRP
jgi:SAM-dependent methyltransferase